MSRIWLTSDTHFNHDRDFIWGPRGFKSVWEMNATIVANWNSVVNADDEVFHLGDVMLGEESVGLSYLKDLKGHIHIIRGNHDTNNRMELYKQCWNIVEVSEGQFLNYKNYHFYLSHFPCLCSNWDYDKPLKARTISLCGHTHTQDPFFDWDKGLIYHCEMDTNNCTPWLIDDIIDNIKKQMEKTK